MTIYRTSFLSKPQDGQRILPETLAYMRARIKRRAYDLVMREFKRSSITKAELSRRLGKGPDRISRMLGGPGNWTLNTVADLLFAISSAEPKWELSHPLDKPRKNNTSPEWLDLNVPNNIGSAVTRGVVSRVPPGGQSAEYVGSKSLQARLGDGANNASGVYQSQTEPHLGM